ncbi:DUF3800 domain-containing protein [Novosphingobium lubricantis]|jgi:hypothetical protein
MVLMDCFRIDESGYTGFDLLNADQRLQGASAIAISDDDAARLIRDHFPTLQAAELKYRALARRPANHPRLIGLMRDALSAHKCTTYVCDKRFLLALMFVDYAVEPFYYERNLDLYADGRNYAMASLLHSVGPTLFGAGSYRRLMAAFQRAMKEKSPTGLKALVAAARAMNWQALDEVLGPLATGSRACLAAIATPGVSTDAAMVVLQALITRMEEMTDGPYRMEHDQSKNLLTYHGLIQKLIEHEDEIEFRQSEIARMKFPLKLAEVTQVDSKTSPAVQIADILIGAAIEAGNMRAGLRKGGPDPLAVLSLYAEDQFIHLLPSIDFEEQHRFRSGTQASEFIDYYAANFGSMS